MVGRRMHELGVAQSAIKAGDIEKAGALFETVVVAQPECDEAWFGLGEVAQRLGDFESAHVFYSRAIELRPLSFHYRRQRGKLMCQLGFLGDGIAELEEAFRREPNDNETACALSGAYVAAGLWGPAREVLIRVCGDKAAEAGHFCLKGMAAQHLGDLDEALVDFKKAARLDPVFAEAWHSLADVYRLKGDWVKATDGITHALQLSPGNFGMLVTAGHIESSKGNARQAAYFFRQALDIKPDSPEVWASLAIALVYGGEALSAIDALEKAHQLGVSEDWIYEHAGLLFTTRGQLDAAKENLELAVERQPDNLNAWNTLIVVYTKLGWSEKARDAAEKVLALNPRHVNALLNLGSWFSDQARNAEALAEYRKALEINPQSATAYINSLWVLVHSSEANAQDVLNLAREFNRNLCEQHARHRSFAARDRNPTRRLRIGWLTSDLRTHPVGAFVLPFIDKFDAARVENTVYFNSPSSDEVTARCKEVVERWRDVLALGDDELANAIEADEIDILIDLNGNTGGNRLLAVARKPAPIVVTWLGFPGTSGMSAIDYIFVPPDPVLEAGKWCSERPWPLPDCYGVRTGMPDVPVLPGLPSMRMGRPFTFGCLNNFRKASQRTIDLWADILRAVPDSRLVVVARGGTDGMLRAYIHDQFAQRGVAAVRLEIRGILPQVDYFASYNDIDFGLDPFPFNGGTTGYDSIWMGVPYVTWPGDMLVSRMGKAILDNVGLSELVVDSAESYVATAVAMARDRERLFQLRANLRDRMQASPLMNSERFAKGLEEAFRGMWIHWCQQPV